jgi:probable rRNA maturation factor
MTDIIVEVMIEAPGWDALASAHERVEVSVQAALAVADQPLLPGAEISVMLADDARLRDLNQTWRSQDKPTNVLSFPAATSSKLAKAPYLGDIAIAYETLVREADEESKSQDAHLCHLVVHGVLHLLGHDHLDDADAHVMESLERAALARLGYPDPYRGEDAEPSCGTTILNEQDSGNQRRVTAL